MTRTKTQDQISKLDYILTGTILKKFSMCGKENCICKKDKKNWHGPYYIWTRKESGKTITKSLTSTQVKFCLEAISNRKKLNKIIDQWMGRSLETLNKLVK